MGSYSGSLGVPMRSGSSRVPEVKWGTTTIGVACKDGVVFATDTRVVQGETFIAHKAGKKVHKVEEHAAMTMAGGVADAQALLDVLRYQARIFWLERGTRIPIKSLSNIASLVLFGNRLAPMVVQALIGGLDYDGPSLFQIDPFGGVTRETLISTGSGSPVALGFLEANIHKDMSCKDVIPLAAKAVLTAMNRDTATGNDFDVVVVDSAGYRELSSDEKGIIAKKIAAV
ncbi:MAG TPA: proteasome subunit beta [Thermoproteota archaeon]|nr:proteasome subunit beta [Thermoproteota archaeon]